MPFMLPQLMISSSGYTANAVNFDGSGDYLNRGGDLTGVAGSKLWTVSVWVKIPNVASAEHYIFNDSGGNRYNFSVQAGGLVQITARTSGNFETLRVNATAAVSSAAWAHILFSVDLSDTGKRHLYVNGTDTSPSWDTYSNAAMGFSDSEHYINGYNTSSDNVMDMAEAWFDIGTYIDFDVESNRELFASGGKPVNLGDNGEIPTGSSPIMFFSGETDLWHTNKGTGGGFTENGALTTASTLPSY